MLSQCIPSSSPILNCSNHDHRLNATVIQILGSIEEIAKIEREGKLDAISKAHFQAKFDEGLRQMELSFQKIEVDMLEMDSDSLETVFDAKIKCFSTQEFTKEAKLQKERLLKHADSKAGPTAVNQMIADKIQLSDAGSRNLKSTANHSLRAVSRKLKDGAIDMLILKHHLARLALLIEIARLKLLPSPTAEQEAALAEKIKLYEAQNLALLQKTKEQIITAALTKQQLDE